MRRRHGRGQGATVGLMLVLAWSWFGPHPVATAAASPRVVIAGGTYRPLYRRPVAGASRDTVVRRAVAVPVAPFVIDRTPVTNRDYLAFVTAHPEWRRSRVSRLFADRNYLARWSSDLDPGPRAPLDAAVVEVSWFAVRAYAAARRGRLPTTAEWELVAAADRTRREATRDARYLERLRQWYARPAPTTIAAVGQGPANAWGVQDLHTLVWEWTLDFNASLVTGESRGDASLERGLFCGAGASAASDFADYAAFMREAFRASLDADYALGTLGFRCAYDLAPGRTP